MCERERERQSDWGLEKAGELSVMLSVSGAGCDKRGSLAAGWYLSLPFFPANTNTHKGGRKDPVVFLSATHE